MGTTMNRVERELNQYFDYYGKGFENIVSGFSYDEERNLQNITVTSE